MQDRGCRRRCDFYWPSLLPRSTHPSSSLVFITRVRMKKKPFYCAEAALNSALNRRSVVVFDRLWANAAPISNRAFSCSNFHAKWWYDAILLVYECKNLVKTMLQEKGRRRFPMTISDYQCLLSCSGASVSDSQCRFSKAVTLVKCIDAAVKWLKLSSKCIFRVSEET